MAWVCSQVEGQDLVCLTCSSTQEAYLLAAKAVCIVTILHIECQHRSCTASHCLLSEHAESPRVYR